MTIKSIFDNWKTSSIGVLAIVGGVIHLAYAIRAHGLTESDCTTTVMAILGGIGLIAAGDAKQTPPPPPPPITTTKVEDRN